MLVAAVIALPVSKSISSTVCGDHFSFRREMTGGRVVGVSWYSGTVIDDGVTALPPRSVHYRPAGLRPTAYRSPISPRLHPCSACIFSVALVERLNQRRSVTLREAASLTYC